MPARLVPLPLLGLAVALTPAPATDPPAVAPPPRPVVRPVEKLPPGIDPALADWTPRPATGIAEPWERAIEANWVDDRFRRMDTGPFLDCTMQYPRDKSRQTVFKATVVRLTDGGATGAVVFDRSTLQLAAGWAGGWLQHSDRRFGLLNTPTPVGETVFVLPPGPGWAARDRSWDAAVKRHTAPLPAEWARYRGLHVNGDRVVFEYTVGGRTVLETARLVASAGGPPTVVNTVEVTAGKKAVVRAAKTPGAGVEFPPSDTPQLTARSLGGPAAVREVPSQVAKPGPKRWGEPIVTKLERGTGDGPFAVDTLTIPYRNRFNALFFCTGVDFLPDGRVAVCTCHGDVWLVTVDEKAATCSWQRFATGLYHPLGLKVVDGNVVVLERGQLTRLHDENRDGEADYYECVSNAWHTGGGEHSYDTCLETDPAGNFLFFKTGDTDLPSGGTLIKVSKDGETVETFATGFRHPIGLGMSPTGVVTGGDQEGNWMPATRLDEYKKGGFYGDMRAHHRDKAPTIYDGPLCWVPREVDNSAGGQVWVPKDTFGPLAGLPLHLSFGRCRPYVLLRQPTDLGVTQGGVVPLDVRFLSGTCRGRFGKDGHLYVCGLNGWQTAAKADGCLQRVRWTGRPLDVPVKMVVDGNALRLTFSRPVDAKAAADPANWRAAWWNYRWSGDYGSKRWKVSDAGKEGQDEVPVRGAKVLADGKTVELKFDKLQPVMQMQVAYNLPAGANSVYLTIHSTKPK